MPGGRQEGQGEKECRAAREKAGGPRAAVAGWAGEVDVAGDLGYCEFCFGCFGVWVCLSWAFTQVMYSGPMFQAMLIDAFPSCSF